MTIKLAITGKSGSGKTTVTKAFLRIFKEMFPEKSILLFDNDLSSELGHSFGLDIRNTIYGIRSGKHEYKTGIPQDMTKQEYIDWALEDIVVQLDENVDIIVSWLVASKDCRCPITKQINDALVKFIERYDIVIFDCEFDLKYLNQLVDVEVDTALIVANPTDESAHLAKRIEEFSAKYSAGGQIGVILNKVENTEITSVFELLKKYDLEILGVIPTDKELIHNSIEKDSELVQESIKQFYFRLNLPQGG
ncbi:MAG TPA: AAA family ATPase [Candidatus Gastranaerophilaceae bacterium]|nr:AAA family ATPase [Candidatus Gastranaerophilaceae bacterium]